ncbi:alpha/beta fold hydrolase [Bacillus sp. B1-b2]|uniref:alpha/beta fold hydrolase n=1 Tax=Bacillus sp. B1-b2 TaxID=2653201 RepID=UPI001261AB12|nr:alpha/beta fold hydrolase [Bacillus sp. B1-b2]KAB7666473.1 alpha/beta fold hydrolase [Bacillus sp. B1-b2]
MTNNRITSFIQALTVDPVVGTSERYAIWKKNKATLWYYPTKEKKYKEPIYLVYSIVNKPYILDLGPSMSLIEAFNKAGYDTYLIDFGIPGYEDRFMTMDDYIVKYIHEGFKRAIRHAGEDLFTVIGFCLGGTLATIFAALDNRYIKNLILAVSPIDFSAFPDYDKWLTALQNQEIQLDEMIDKMGVIPPESIKYGTRLIVAPVSFSHYLALLNRANNEQYIDKWTRMNKWTLDHIPVAGAALKQIMNDLIRDNKIVEGGLTVYDKPIDFKDIKSNLLVFSTMYDPLVPSALCEPIMDLVSSEDKLFVLFEGGHAALVAKEHMPEPMEKWLLEHTTPL